MFLSRLNAYAQPCKRASRTFAFESCATYINWLSSPPSSFVFCSFPSIIVNTSFVPSRVSFFTFHSRETRASTQLSNRITVIIRFQVDCTRIDRKIIAIFGRGTHSGSFSARDDPRGRDSFSPLPPPGRKRTFRDKSRTLAWPTRNKWNVIESRLKTAQESKKQREKR